MSRIRTIKPEWLDDEVLSMASSDARVLSVALIVLADDYGNGRIHRLQLSARVFPGRPPSVFDDALADLVDKCKFARTYEVDGQHYFSIRNWSKHQRVDHPGKPKVPPPPELQEKPRRSSRKSREDSRITPEGFGGVGEGLGPRASPPLHSPLVSSESDLPGGAGGAPDSDRETVVPLDLVARCDRVGIPEQFAKAYSVPPEAVREDIRETLTFWSIGGGAGKRKKNWMLVVRNRLHEQGKQGRLGNARPRGGNASETRAERQLREHMDHLAQVTAEEAAAGRDEGAFR